MTRDELIAFEADIAAEFNAGRIRAPIHLDGGNEDQLIKIFNEWNIGPDDWVCGSWRMHYKCLLHGVPPDKLKAAIMAGRSITLTFPEHRVISSAIVGGILPIALGLAWAEKRKPEPRFVWCFIGDMTANTGTAYEVNQYAMGHELPLVVIAEDNGKSVCTDTKDVWGWNCGGTDDFYGNVRASFEYTLPFPHAGAGQRVQF